jgi:hypothetical protein
MDPASQFGRGTPAGKAIFRLYNKKNMDSTLDPELLARLQKMRKEKEEEAKLNAPPKAVPKSRAHVNVPRPLACPEPTAEQVALRKLAMLGHRRREDVIRECASSEPAPVRAAPLRPAITEAEKDKLRQVMEFGQVLPAGAGAAGSSSNACGARQARPVQSLYERRFDELTMEINERKQFLADMKLPGSTLGGKTAAERKATDQRILVEIRDRIQEMKELDEKLRSEADEN